MTELLTAAQMRAIETAAIESGSVTGLELMERAGRGVVEAIFEEWPELAQTPKRAVVFCGPGNNGGDGFVVARLLKEWGWEVDVFLYGDPKNLPPDAAMNYVRWGELGTVNDLSTENALAQITCPHVVVDSVFGTGLTRPIKGALAQILQRLDGFHKNMGVKVVAIDLPSGLCSDSGRNLGPFTTANLTVSFQTAKLGHYLNRGCMQSGKMVVKDIGLGSHIGSNADANGSRSKQDDRCADLNRADVAHLIGPPSKYILDKARRSHKYTHGHALVLTGGLGKTGAARLTARGALRIGAGLVTLVVPPSAQMEVACQITALMMKEISNAAALTDLLKDDRISSVCLGPGLGTDKQAGELVAAALRADDADHSMSEEYTKRSVVLDADALTLIGKSETLFSSLHEGCVLTPHAGEFKRLFPDIAAQLHAPATNGPAYSKVDATRDAARRAGCVVLFKGPDTVIAAPDGRCSVNAAFHERAAPWLATAGSGDVLAGFITGLLARGVDPMRAAEVGAWLHVECARRFGPGLIAEDLPEVLPKVFADLNI